MGAFPSRRNANIPEVDVTTANAYRYPPKSGCYFGTHFIMGGEKFETTQPEAYLFGENADLNFLGGRPQPFPYPAPQAHEPTKTLKSLVNIRKDSLRFVKAIDKMSPKKETEENENEDSESHTKYNIEFTFDSDVKVAITVYYFATEEMVNNHVVYHPKDASMNSETYHYKRGANQTFTQTTHIIDPSKYNEEEWHYSCDKDVIPVVIQCVVEDEQHRGHSHTLFAFVEKFSDTGYIVKPLKQKQVVDGLSYLLQEIYGIENKSKERSKLDDDLDDNGSECVICMCETRDTLILPCRHLCLCNMCADNLRYQANNCPICRAPFRALLQIRALRKKSRSITNSQQSETTDENSTSQEGVPSGYEAVSLLEALNGPDQPATSPANQNNHFSNNQSCISPDDDSTTSLKRKGKRSSGRSNRRNQKANKMERALQPQNEVPVKPEIVMTVHATEPVKENNLKLNLDIDEDVDNLVNEELKREEEKQEFCKCAVESPISQGLSDSPLSPSDIPIMSLELQSTIEESKKEEDKDLVDSDKPSMSLLHADSSDDSKKIEQDGSSYSSTGSGKGLLDSDGTSLPEVKP